MNQWEAMEQRHSVRAYEPRPIDTKAREQLEALIAQCNAESGLHMQLITDEPLAFTGMKAHYGTFSGVRHYIAVVGQKGKEVSEICGYYGEKVVLFAQQLGLNTCWVGLTYNRKKAAVSILDGEKLYLVIAVGYGKTQGVAHRSKTKEAVTQTDGAVPCLLYTSRCV